MPDYFSKEKNLAIQTTDVPYTAEKRKKMALKMQKKQFIGLQNAKIKGNSHFFPVLFPFLGL